MSDQDTMGGQGGRWLGPPCPKGVENEQRIIALETVSRDIKEELKEIKMLLAKRLPLWATALITLLSMVVAGFVGSLL